VKELKSKKMKELLDKGIKRTKLINKTLIIKNPECTYPIFTEELKNGYYYQVDWVCIDTEPTIFKVTVYGFKPSKNLSCRPADFVLQES